MTSARTEELVKYDREHILHAQIPLGETLGVIYDSADGIVLRDTEGKEYLDASSQMVSANLGHGRREIIDAVTDAARQAAARRPVLRSLQHADGRVRPEAGHGHPRRPRPLLVHVGRRRVDRRRHPAGAALLDGRRPAHQAQGRQPLHELPRHRQRAHEHDRHPGHAGRLRPRGAGLPARSPPTTATAARSASSTRPATRAARATWRPSSRPRAPRTSPPSSPSPSWAPRASSCRRTPTGR